MSLLACVEAIRHNERVPPPFLDLRQSPPTPFRAHFHSQAKEEGKKKKVGCGVARGVRRRRGGRRKDTLSNLNLASLEEEEKEEEEEEEEEEEKGRRKRGEKFKRWRRELVKKKKVLKR